MKNNLLYFLIFISCILFLQGCGVGIGAAVIGTQTASISYPCISTKKGLFSPYKTESNPITSNELLKYWGNPDKIIKIDQNTEEWTYKFSLKWNGVGALIGIVPIPLVAPVGRDYIIFTIKNHEVVSAFMEKEGDSGCLFAAFPPHLVNECSDSTGDHEDSIIADLIDNDDRRYLCPVPKK